MELNEASESIKSSGQKIVALSAIEEELIEIVSCKQEMLCIVRLLESMGLQVKKSMIFQSEKRHN